MGLFTITPQGCRNFRVLKWWGIGFVAAAVLAGGLAPQAGKLLATAGSGDTDGQPREFPSIRASELALDDIPLVYLAYYHAAADTCPDLRWQLLAAIGKKESNHGQSDAPGVKPGSGLNRAGCCAGPMQFNLVNGPPSTWDSFKRDYNGDGRVDVYDPADTIPAAAEKLCANGLEPTPDNQKWKGVPGGDPCPEGTATPAEHRTLRRYNNACWYVHEVLEMAGRYTSGSPANPTPATDPFLVALADHPNLPVTDSRGCDPAADLASGRLDIRVRALLLLLAEDYEIQLSCLKTGHSEHVKGTDRTSNHFVWRAVDINQVNGQPVSATNQDARRLVDRLDRLVGSLRPSEVGSPFAFGRRPYFTDTGHQGHIHIGYSRTYNP